jgi:hypothetical protein
VASRSWSSHNGRWEPPRSSSAGVLTHQRWHASPGCGTVLRRRTFRRHGAATTTSGTTVGVTAIAGPPRASAPRLTRRPRS